MAEESVPQDIINRCLPVSEERVPQDIIGQCLRAGQEGKIDDLYRLIREYPRVLEQIDSTPFAETPLHAAASKGNIAFALEIMTLKPSLSRKLNRDGLTPLHLVLSKLQTHENPALQQTPPSQNQQVPPDPDLALAQILPQSNPASPLVPMAALQPPQRNMDLEAPSDQNHQQTQPDTDQQAQPEPNPSREKLYKLVLCFLQFDKELARVKGKGGLTPLHYAAQIGDLQLLKEILTTCPMSILDVTVESETALHVALKKKQWDAYKCLRKWLDSASIEDVSLRKKLENWKDTDNRTFCKIAHQEKSQMPPDGTFVALRDRFVGGFVPYARVKEEYRSAVAVIFILLVTISFQITLTPPGGTWQDDHNCTANDASSCAYMPSHRAGTAIMGRGPFTALTVVNSFSLWYSVSILIVLLPNSWISVVCIIPLCYFVAYFIISVCVTYPSPKALSSKTFYTVFLIPFLYLSVYLCFIMKAKTVHRR